MKARTRIKSRLASNRNQSKMATKVKSRLAANRNQTVVGA